MKTIIDSTSVVVQGLWVKSTEYNGYTGNGYIRWMGPNRYSNPGDDSTMTYMLNVDKSGTYPLKLRVRRDKEGRELRDDEENDVWLKVNDGEWLKLFHGSSWGVWGVGGRFDLHNVNGTRPEAMIDLKEGLNTIHLSGRSENFMIDSIIIDNLGTSAEISTDIYRIRVKVKHE